MTYVIYNLKCGRASYIGSSNNFKRRLSQHLKALNSNSHSNDLLQTEYNRRKELRSKVLTKFNTMFRSQVLLKEQRYINRYSNCNEAKASKIVSYSKKEFLMDLADFIKNNWKVVSVILFIALILGYGMTTEQATNFINQIVSFYQSL